MQNEKWNLNNSYSKLPKIFYTKQQPTPVCNPKLVLFNDSLAEFLGVPLQSEVFAGNAVPENATPISQAYAGHQFGYFTMLGDGRAVLLGEQITPSGKRFDIQLKGSGKTSYSRGGDGRAAIKPMLREYLISEAMHALGIETTRSLAVVETGETVAREKLLPGAILTRVAASHIRVGTFEYAANFGTIENLRRLADYTIERHFPYIISNEHKYLSLLQEVIQRQASLVAKWQLVGFVHGVMNTDNMAISGETIDYGPCAFMDTYNPNTVFSSIDKRGRYAYKNQPKIAAWNLARFAESLLPILHEDKKKALKITQEELDKFHEIYHSYWLKGMREKLGLFEETNGYDILIYNLLELMQKYKADYTNTFRALTLGNIDKSSNIELFAKPEFYDWNNQWQLRLAQQKQSEQEIKKIMQQNNPVIIPRNHLVEEALDSAENGDLSLIKKLLNSVSNPYDYTIEQEYFNSPIPTSCGYKTFCGT